jgi:AhpD family alkylhydroperoxidase
MKKPALVAALALIAAPVLADDAAQTRDQIAAAMGGVPSFIDGVADAALPGLWKTYVEFQANPDTALDPKTKSLISLAVAAQIPCTYCIWQDTREALAAGATQDEVEEAVATAAMTRAWSTIFNGTQVDFETFKAEMGGS